MSVTWSQNSKGHWLRHDMAQFLQTGQVIILVKSVDAEWLVGQVGEREGMFPRSFIKVKIPLPGEVSLIYIFNCPDTCFMSVQIEVNSP